MSKLGIRVPEWLAARIAPRLTRDLSQRSELTGTARRTWTIIPHVHRVLSIGPINIEIEFGPLEFQAVGTKTTT